MWSKSHRSIRTGITSYPITLENHIQGAFGDPANKMESRYYYYFPVSLNFQKVPVLAMAQK